MEINSKETIITEIEHANQRAVAWFEGLPAASFFTREGETWSPSDNVDHLIKAIRPIALALRMPKIGIQAMFGKVEHLPRSYDVVCELYLDAIAKGAQASGRFLPDQEQPAQKSAQKKVLLGQLDKANHDLISVVEKWSDEELDRYQLPHPILGKLTIREMLFFSIYHTLRHARIEGD